MLAVWLVKDVGGSVEVLESTVVTVLTVLISDVGESLSVVLVASLIDELADVNSGASDTVCDALVVATVDSEDDRSVDEDRASVVEAVAASDVDVDNSDDDPVSRALDMPPEDTGVVSAVPTEVEVASTEESLSGELMTDEVVDAIPGRSV